MTHEMNFAEFKSAVFSILPENDPYRESKELQLRNWCYSFFELLINSATPCLQFLLEVLSEEDCWENTDSVHRMELNRRKIAKKMIQLQSLTGKDNTIHITKRFKIASWCCLVEDIVTIFNQYKRQYEIKDYDAAGLKWLIKQLRRDIGSDPLTEYWLHIMGGCSTELPLKGKHLYEYGLYLELNGRPNKGHYIGYVEGVEFFWNKIKTLPEDKLNAQQKHEVFMKTAACAATGECANNAEIFEFCFAQISAEHCLEFLVRASYVRNCSSIFHLLRYMCRFDQLQKLFDCLGPNLITEEKYRKWLENLIELQYSENYANVAMKLFMHIWRKEGFDEHRAYVLRNEMENSEKQGTLLKLLARRNYMEPFWTILENATPDQVKEFMDSDHTDNIHNVLQNRCDHHSLMRFFVPNSPTSSLCANLTN